MMRMEAVTVSIQDVINMTSYKTGDQCNVDYSASDTSDCTLNCHNKPSDFEQVTYTILTWIIFGYIEVLKLFG